MKVEGGRMKRRQFSVFSSEISNLKFEISTPES
jgi:hypothetical protein